MQVATVADVNLNVSLQSLQAPAPEQTSQLAVHTSQVPAAELRVHAELQAVHWARVGEAVWATPLHVLHDSGHMRQNEGLVVLTV